MANGSRSFISRPSLFDQKSLGQCEADLLDKIKALDEATLVAALKPYVDKTAVHGLIQRRDKIVAFFDAKGPSAVFRMPQDPE